jgi:hypothetical protein
MHTRTPPTHTHTNAHSFTQNSTQTHNSRHTPTLLPPHTPEHSAEGAVVLGADLADDGVHGPAVQLLIGQNLEGDAWRRWQGSPETRTAVQERGDGTVRGLDETSPPRPRRRKTLGGSSLARATPVRGARSRLPARHPCKRASVQACTCVCAHRRWPRCA